MLRNAKELERLELHARDGVIGHVQDLFFDDRAWTVRYLVVDTGGWLSSRKVLISPVAATRVDVDRKAIAVDLTREQVRQSPSIDTEQPVSREHEAALTQYYSWPAYWGAAGFPDVGFAASAIPMIPVDTMGAGGADDPRLAERQGTVAAHPTHTDHHLRSTRAVAGHRIEAADGSIGHVDDFLIDDASWQIAYLVVDTRNWWPGRKVVISPEWIREVGWEEAKVGVDLTREAVKSSPTYDPTKQVSPDYSAQLREHYARQRHSRR